MRLNMKEKIKNNKQIILFIIGVVVAIIIIFIKIFGGNDDNKNIDIVKSSSRFYTVSNCVSRYINYLYSEETDNLLLLLDSNYKKKNKINQNNLYDKINKLENYYNFEAKKIYEENINNHKVKYYVYGYLTVDDVFNSVSDKADFYIIVYLDSKDSTYSVEPYDGKIFTNGDMNEER